MLVIAPIFSWIVSMVYGVQERSGFSVVVLMIIMLPLLFIVGLVLFLKGIFLANHERRGGNNKWKQF